MPVAIHALDIGPVITLLGGMAGLITHPGADRTAPDQAGTGTHGSPIAAAHGRTGCGADGGSYGSSTGTGLCRTRLWRGATDLCERMLAAKAIITGEVCKGLMGPGENQNARPCRDTGATGEDQACDQACANAEAHGFFSGVVLGVTFSHAVSQWRT